MAHGLEVYTAAGATRLAVVDKITRLIHSQFIAAGSSGSVTIAGFSNSTHAAVLVGRRASSIGYVAPAALPSMTISGTTISWSWSWWTGISSWRSDCDLLVFAFS